MRISNSTNVQKLLVNSSLALCEARYSQSTTRTALSSQDFVLLLGYRCGPDLDSVVEGSGGGFHDIKNLNPTYTLIFTFTPCWFSFRLHEELPRVASPRVASARQAVLKGAPVLYQCTHADVLRCVPAIPIICLTVQLPSVARFWKLWFSASECRKRYKQQ